MGGGGRRVKQNNLKPIVHLEFLCPRYPLPRFLYQEEEEEEEEEESLINQRASPISKLPYHK